MSWHIMTGLVPNQYGPCPISHYDDVIIGAIASQITSFTSVYSTVYSVSDKRKHQSSASLAFVRGIHRGPVNSPHKMPVARKMFPFDDVIMCGFTFGLHHLLIVVSRPCIIRNPRWWLLPKRDMAIIYISKSAIAVSSHILMCVYPQTLGNIQFRQKRINIINKIIKKLHEEYRPIGHYGDCFIGALSFKSCIWNWFEDRVPVDLIYE